MLNFSIHTSTEVIFGRDIEPQIGAKLKSLGATRVLLHFGGKSARASGLLDKVENSLTQAGLPFVSLGGVQVNPKISLVREGVELCKRENVDFILAVGGGSVLDSAKGIGMGVATGRDPWDFAMGLAVPDKTLPVATVLTLAASGSETSNSCVLTNEQTKEKRGITSQTNRPVVSFLNPENTYTVPPFQTSCGVVDIMMHTIERYVTDGGESDLTDRIAEGVLIATRDAGRRLLRDPRDYEARATMMWAGSVSHNDYTGVGRTRLFPVHKMEHELSAYHDDITHAAGLSVLYPAWATFVLDHALPRLTQLANRVFSVEMDFQNPRRTAQEGIEAVKRLFSEFGMPTKMSELGLSPEDYEVLAQNTLRTTGGPVQSFVPLDKDALLAIYHLAE